MSDLRAIEIDFDVNKLIELERQSFAETPNDVLRRLLKLPDRKNQPGKQSTPQGRPWSGMGVVLTTGTDLRMKYNGTLHLGRIENGTWVVENKEFSSPSAAASGVARTKSGRATTLDGWEYWEVKRPSDLHWMPIKTLRDQSKP